MKKENVKKAFKITGHVFAVLLVVIEVLLIIFLVLSKVQGGPPSLFGYQMYIVRTGSMRPYLEVGDVIISEEYEGGELLAGEDGDIVTYYGEVKGKTELITHRVISVEGNTVITKGDDNPTADTPISKDAIVSVMTYKTVIIDDIYAIISTTWGFWLLIFTPIALLIVAETFSLIREIKKEKEVADNGNEDQNE